ILGDQTNKLNLTNNQNLANYAHRYAKKQSFDA
ncbi:MAG: hypothetical protein RLZZ361_874, partial [Cyanobacteriota bacterium]